MSEKEILEEISDKRYLVEYSGAYEIIVSPEKLAAFLAKHLSNNSTD